MYFITTKRMLEVCFSAHPNIQYRTLFCLGFWEQIYFVPKKQNSGNTFGNNLLG